MKQSDIRVVVINGSMITGVRYIHHRPRTKVQCLIARVIRILLARLSNSCDSYEVSITTGAG